MVETLGGTQARWAHANDENINVAVVVLSMCGSPQAVDSCQEAGGGSGRKAYVSAIVKAVERH